MNLWGKIGFLFVLDGFAKCSVFAGKGPDFNYFESAIVSD